MKRALIVQGGWEGHDPLNIAGLFSHILREEGFSVAVYDSLSAFDDLAVLKEQSLIVPVWTMGEIDDKKVANVCEAVASGVGLAGCHGGMCDAFRNSVDWQFLTGSQWVAHPGGDGVEYLVEINRSSDSPIVAGIPDFRIKSEQYYLHVDPAVNVLATTRFPVFNGNHAANRAVDMPVVYTKRWGKGKVFYNSLGHQADVFATFEAKELMRRGFLWAAKEG